MALQGSRRIVLLTGATGFLGRYVARKLVHSGREVRCLVRRTADLSVLQYLPVEVWHGDVTDPESLNGVMENVDTVVHLVAIIREHGQVTFERVNYQGTRNLVEAAKAGGAKRFVHMSALGVGPYPQHKYFYTKWLGEEEVRNSGLPYTILRSSMIFGPEDEFFNRFAKLARKPPMGLFNMGPVLPVPGSGNTIYQPIWVEDVAECILRTLGSAEVEGKTIEIGGPEHLTYNQILDLIFQTLKLKRWKLHLPVFMMLPAVWAMEKVLPDPLATLEELKMASTDNKTDLDAVSRTFGFAPASIREKIGYIVTQGR